MLDTFAKWLLKRLGWHADLTLPEVDKYVLVGAPHTSNWDFPFAMLFFFSTGLRFNWVGKHTLFVWPVSRLFRAMGGIPLNRNASGGFIEQTVQLIKSSKAIILTIAPEGTRSRTECWRTGFYYIALQAKVPIALGYIDYDKKQLGIGSFFTPTGDIDKDLMIIQLFYQDKTGKHPENQGPIRFTRNEAARR
ncbi:MAG: lysophospholipid acyltransferase family protein [Gammaproteobacteria bacterium]